jgi:hypothetical protein
VNPLTGDLVGSFDRSYEDLSSNCSVTSSVASSSNSSKESTPVPNYMTTPLKNKIPPGGYCTPLW